MSLNEIFKGQKDLIKNCKKYLIEEKKKRIDISTSPLCFFTTWANSPGNLKLNDFCGIKYKKKIFYYIKNLLSASKYFDLKIFYNKNFKKKYDNLIISYSQKKNFDSNGNYLDEYFKYDSNDRNNFWFLISLDQYVPIQLKQNIFVIAKQNKFAFSLYYLFSELFKIIIFSNYSYKKIKHYLWNEYIFSNKVLNILKPVFKEVEFRNLILNYEGIPFQNSLINFVKKKYKKVKVFGYLHCAPWPLQTDLIYKKKLLDKLIVSGEDQKKVLNNHYGWKNSEIKVVPSLRFIKKKRKEFIGSIFIPFNLNNYKVYLDKFETLLRRSPNNFFNNLYSRIHPLNKSSKVHKKFSKAINKLLHKYNKKLSNKKKLICIFFGSATGVCIQALEEGNEVIHFPSNETLDVFSPNIWKNLTVIKIEEGIFKYKILKKGKMFITNYEKNKFQKYIFPIIK